MGCCFLRHTSQRHPSRPGPLSFLLDSGRTFIGYAKVPLLKLKPDLVILCLTPQPWAESHTPQRAAIWSPPPFLASILTLAFLISLYNHTLSLFLRPLVVLCSLPGTVSPVACLAVLQRPGAGSSRRGQTMESSGLRSHGRCGHRRQHMGPQTLGWGCDAYSKSSRK